MSCFTASMVCVELLPYAIDTQPPTQQLRITVRQIANRMYVHANKFSRGRASHIQQFRHCKRPNLVTVVILADGSNGVRLFHIAAELRKYLGK